MMNQGTSLKFGEAGTTKAWLLSLGIVLCLFWVYLWVLSAFEGALVGAPLLWTPAYHFLGVDFLHNYHVANLWLSGGNPYEEFSGAPLEIRYPYPPIVIRFFAWCGLLQPLNAIHVWILALAMMAAFGAWLAWKSRRELGLYHIPFPLVLAAVWFSTPVMYAVERGNHDLAVLVLIGAAALCLRGRSLGRECLAGAFLALAAWLKIYPGLLFLGLVGLRRWRGALAFLATAAGIGCIDIEGTRQFIENLKVLIAQTGQAAAEPVSTMRHSLSAVWGALWNGTPLAFFAKVPGILACLYLFIPPLIWVSHRLYRCPRVSALIYPYLLWIAAVATFFPGISNDYNLVFLPLAVLAVWSPKDPLYLQAMLLSLVLWWQPFHLPIDGRWLLASKILGVTAVSLCLVRRATEPEQVLKPVPVCGEGTSAAFWRGYQLLRSLLFGALALSLIFASFWKNPLQSGPHQDAKEIAFASIVEAMLPPGALVLQLPFFPYTQHASSLPAPKKPFWGHLYSQRLRWSYAVKGREGHTLQNLMQRPFSEFLENLVLEGFGGIVLDRFGFADAGKTIESRLQEILESYPVVSPDGRLAYYSLGAFADNLRTGMTNLEWQEKKREADLPLLLDWQGGFYFQEGDPMGEYWRWSSANGLLYIYNPDERIRRVSIQGTLATGNMENSEISILSPVFRETYSVNERGISFSKTFSVPPGKTLIQFSSKAKRLKAPNDDRDLEFRIMNFRVGSPRQIPNISEAGVGL
ncbi:MAG: glycosyltransferase family 87 protein [bacterium]